MAQFPGKVGGLDIQIANGNTRAVLLTLLVYIRLSTFLRSSTGHQGRYGHEFLGIAFDKTRVLTLQNSIFAQMV